MRETPLKKRHPAGPVERSPAPEQKAALSWTRGVCRSLVRNLVSFCSLGRATLHDSPGRQLKSSLSVCPLAGQPNRYFFAKVAVSLPQLDSELVGGHVAFAGSASPLRVRNARARTTWERAPRPVGRWGSCFALLASRVLPGLVHARPSLLLRLVSE